ncbi:hypothetical protein GE061_014956 [Apolygus lucorum]|uniref:Uncharacterized protein n=1 Tax=Apolygus lucorum TaxID=248454 RepID=A0A6A4JRU9_APOLU|nr:hypothetical protein GE061_014956 [Apolygus lucorum]
MPHIPEAKPDSTQGSDESLNFQLAQPVVPPSSSFKLESKVEDLEGQQSEKTYLETEIDSYSGLDFKNGRSVSTSIRPPTPTKPTLRAFTFDTTNPFAVGTSDNALKDLYSTVNKTKSKPEVPPKPSSKQINIKSAVQSNDKRFSTVSLFDNAADSNGCKKIRDEGLIQRVNSLPNLEPLQLVQVGNRLQPVHDIQRNSTIGYGVINKIKENGTCLKPLPMTDDSNADYCDMIPDSPLYINELPNDSENVYEDVKISSPKRFLAIHQQRPPHNFVSDVLSKTPDGDYTEMVSPISDVSFSFQSSSIYENLPVHSSERNDSSGEVLEPPLEFSSRGYPIIPDSNRAPDSFEYNTSKSPYYVNSETISHGQQSDVSLSPSSSLASTVASSFQGIQVCYFPPQPSPDFYGDVNTCGLPAGSMNSSRRPGSTSDFSIASSSDISRRSSTTRSRSRIPVPVKSPRTPDLYPQHPHISVPEEPAPPLPSTPSPSPVIIPKNKKKSNKQEIKLSPSSPPTGKSARWYEKLGCIQSDTIQPAEPYGVPGERKRSKSLNKEHRKSKFFVPFEPNDEAPSGTSTSPSNT